MLIKITEDWMGNVTARPVSEKNRLAIAADMVKNGAPESDDNGTIFMQQPQIEEVRETFGEKAIFRGEVNDGATFRFDDWDFRQMCGFACG